MKNGNYSLKTEKDNSKKKLEEKELKLYTIKMTQLSNKGILKKKKTYITTEKITWDDF